MPAPSDRIRAAALHAQSELADERTPFVFDCWYVAALADEVTRSPLARRILGLPLVLFRREDGRAVALEDRCPHRSMPLSRGTLEGDTLVCAYHGARYDCSGRCTGVPSQAQVPPGALVRDYALIESGRLVWIWMGAAESADPAQLPQQDWMTDPAWVSSTERMHLGASYVRLHENLLDLTHLSFLHAKTFGTPDYASAAFETRIDEAAGRFGLLRSVVPTRLPPIWGRPTRLEGRDAARIAESTFHSPGLHVVAVKFYACDRPESEQPSQAIRTAHIVTPESATSTHYFIQHARNFANDDAQVTRFMHEQLLTAFQEDVDGLEAIEQRLADYPEQAFEISFQADRASLAMRRFLKRRAEARP
ncbi:MAG: aromatic ring-hydroxylating dioxygenase subunit alpha [Burkholderiales bacterium]|nr:aromatic ring-hydroxylating dioxygenase subunit alpha [Burkholderiales bacterium]